MKVIIDANCIGSIALFAMGDLRMNEVGTGVVYGLLKQLQTIYKELGSSDLVFCWDSQSSIRKEMFSGYKFRRKEDRTKREQDIWATAYEQFHLLRTDYLPSIGFKNQLQATGFEADDILAKVAKDNGNCIVITTDGDLLQCLPYCNIWNPRKRTLITAETFEAEWGIHPKMWGEVKAIAGCFDKQTEILTKRGWVFFPDIQEDDLVYSMDPKTQEADYYPITNIIKYKYKGDMYSIKGPLIDLVVTPNHKFVGNSTQTYNSPSCRNKPQFVEIQKIVDFAHFSIPIFSIFKGKDQPYFVLPEHKTKYTFTRYGVTSQCLRTHPSISIKMETWVAFLGIWLADGYISKNRNGNIGSIGICKKMQPQRGKIKKLLNQMPIKWRETESGFQVDSVQLANYLQPIGNVYTKHIPQEFKDLSPKYLEILIEYMVNGDGHTKTETKSCFDGAPSTFTRQAYYSVNKKLIEDFQEIAIKCGHATRFGSRPPREYTIHGKTGTSKEQYSIDLNKSKSLDLKNKTIDLVPFDDFVYDVTTEPHHTIFVRRNKNSVWSSNCKTDTVPGVVGVGEKTAVKYLQRKLSVTSKRYKDITHFEGQNIIARNRDLVVLPLKHTPSFSLKPNNFSLENFRKLCRNLGMDSLLCGSSLNTWTEILSGT